MVIDVNRIELNWEEIDDGHRALVGQHQGATPGSKLLTTFTSPSMSASTQLRHIRDAHRDPIQREVASRRRGDVDHAHAEIGIAQP